MFARFVLVVTASIAAGGCMPGGCLDPSLEPDPQCQGCFLSKLDNPPVRNIDKLDERADGMGHFSFEEATRTDLGQQYLDFSLSVQASGGDPKLGAVSDELIGLQLLSGTYDAPDSMPWEARGLQLGYSRTTLSGIHVDAFGDQMRVPIILGVPAFASVQMQLDPATMLVPIQLIRVLPPAGSTFDAFLRQFSQRTYKQLWDDVVPLDTQRESAPDFPNHKTTHNFVTTEGTLGFTRPDVVWQTCGIQFRELDCPGSPAGCPDLNVTDEEFVAPINCESGGVRDFTHVRQDLIMAQALPGVGRLPIVLMVARVSTVCPDGEHLAESEPIFSAIGLLDRTPLEVAHELGHVLGLGHVFDCSPTAKHLMCANPDFQSEDISPAECKIARLAAAPLVQDHWGVTVPDPPGHVFTCGMDPAINGQLLGARISIDVCADPATPLADVKASCVAQCKAKFSTLMISPLHLFSSITDCVTELGPSDTSFGCRAQGSPTYYNGGPAAFRVDASGTASVALGNGTQTLSMGAKPIDVTLFPCSSPTCTIVFSELDVSQSGPANLGGQTLSGLEVQNAGLSFGTWLNDGTNRFTLPPFALPVGVNFDVDGHHGSLDPTNSQPIEGTFAPNGSSFGLTGQLVSTDGTVSVSLTGAATGHPPVADFTPKGTFECNTTHAAAVTFSGAPSHDPDNDIALNAWGVDGAFVASGPAFPALLPLGPHVVALDVFDARGAANQAESKVTVVDTTPPTLAASVDPACLWPPNHKLVLFELGNGLDATATDVCDVHPTVKVANVTSNQPPTGGGSGNTPVDVFFGNHAFCVRSERAGTLATPRVYTITIEARDASGNATTKEVTVIVPHDQGSTPCPNVPSIRVVDDGDPRCTAN